MNKMIFLSIVLIAILNVGCEKKIEDKIIGTWDVIEGGSFEQMTFAEKAEGSATDEYGNIYKFNYTIESSKTPAQIDIDFVSRRGIWGIFEFTKDSLVITWDDDGPADRPKYLNRGLTFKMIPSVQSSNFTIDQFEGIWKLEDNSTYIKITKLEDGRLEFNRGFEWEGKPTFPNMFANGNAIYLRQTQGKLKSKFISCNFKATHGEDFEYEIIIERKSKSQLIYKEKYTIGSENLEIHTATKINN